MAEQHEYDRAQWTGECRTCGSEELLDGNHIVSRAEAAAHLNARARASVLDTGLGADRKLTPTIEVGGCFVTAKLDETGALVVDVKVRGADFVISNFMGLHTDRELFAPPRVVFACDADSVSFHG